MESLLHRSQLLEDCANSNAQLSGNEACVLEASVLPDTQFINDLELSFVNNHEDIFKYKPDTARECHWTFRLPVALIEKWFPWLKAQQPSGI